MGLTDKQIDIKPLSSFPIESIGEVEFKFGNDEYGIYLSFEPKDIIFVYHRISLSGILNKYRDILESEGIPTSVDEYVKTISSKWFVKNRQVFAVVGLTFGDRRFKENNGEIWYSDTSTIQFQKGIIKEYRRLV